MLLFYNAETGDGATAVLDGAGNYTFVASIPGFATGWTHITGTASGGVLFYNASTGLGATAVLDGAGNYTFVGSIPGFATGWTHIASANSGSLLFYNAGSGDGATALLDGAGNYTFVGSTLRLRDGMDPYHRNRQWWRTLLQRLDRTRRDRPTRQRRQLHFRGSIPGFATGWTHIASANSG